MKENVVAKFINKITKELDGYLKNQGIFDSKVLLERPSVSDFGDFSTNIALRYAKELHKNPLILGGEIVTFLQSITLPEVEKIEVLKPGFVNFYLSHETKLGHLEYVLERRENFGSSSVYAGKKWVVEHTSPNPNKAMHLGHLRNNLVGMSIVNLLKSAGAEVVSEAVYNNRGIAIAKVMYGFLAHMRREETIEISLDMWIKSPEKWHTPESKEVSPDVFVTECYVKAEADIKNDTELDRKVRQLVVDWEVGDESVWKLWQLVLGYAYAGIDKTLNRLGSHWDHVWYEHEHYQKGKEYVERGLLEGIFRRLDDKAILTDLEAGYGLPDTVLLKNDGTSLYITQDIALTDLKKKTYQADHLVWVIGPEQSVAMKQLFAVCEQLEIGKLADFTHVPYGYVGLRDESGAFQKMSSRDGTVVLIDDVIEVVKEELAKRLREDGKNSDLIADLSEKLAIGAVKFAFLRSDRMQEIGFDVNQSVDVTGDSGMYVLYSYVRARSILRKAGAEGAGQNNINTTSGSEEPILRTLLHFESVVEKSVRDLSVHHVAQYLLELCSGFNRWYAKEIILDGTDSEGYKLMVVEAVAGTIKNGLTLLGIETVEEI